MQSAKNAAKKGHKALSMRRGGAGEQTKLYVGLLKTPGGKQAIA